MDWENVSWEDFTGAIRAYHRRFCQGGDEENYYIEVLKELRDCTILTRSVLMPSILLFLNRWHCRIERETAVPVLKRWVFSNWEVLDSLTTLTIHDPDMLAFTDACDRLYWSLLNLRAQGIYNMSHVGASGILHLMIPDLFMMWKPAREDTRRGYGSFMTDMFFFATHVRYIIAPTEAVIDFEGYMQELLDLPMRKPLTKYLDEYNWYRSTGKYRS